jgi:predicted transcriptional regulator
MRMGRRRGEVQILLDVLGTTVNGVRVTQLMYKANLSYSTLRRYLSGALSEGWILKENNSDGSVVYHITEDGKRLLERLRDVKGFLR